MLKRIISLLILLCTFNVLHASETESSSISIESMTDTELFDIYFEIYAQESRRMAQKAKEKYVTLNDDIIFCNKVQGAHGKAFEKKMNDWLKDIGVL